jgi:hypothetical protein
MRDARTYNQVSYIVQYEWGQQVLDWRKWHGDEIVIDAGCGSGLLTKKMFQINMMVHQSVKSKCER